MDLETKGCEEQANQKLIIDQLQSTTQSSSTGLVRCRDKKPPKRYTEQQLQELLPRIKNGALSMYHVTKYYGIPHSTLQFRLSKKCKHRGARGRMPVLLKDEEDKICKWLNEMERKGFPITRQRLQLKIAGYIKSNPRDNPFKGNVPGRRWIDAFLRRHPQFSMRTPEAVTVASARVSEDDIRRWFATVLNYLESHNLVDILKDPSRILNGDESGFSIQPGCKRVIATKGKKNIPIIEPGNAKQNVTVMYTFAADGTVIPPHVILPYKRLSKELIQSFPGDWGLGTSASGWMDTLNFVEYIKKVLYPTLMRNKTKFPVIYFVDGHKSHMAFEAAEVCENLGIILVALCPNTTRILQPADVAVFRPLKNAWTRVIEEMKSENPSESVTMLNFGKLLQKANTIALKQSTIQNGFRTCGLFPLNPDAVDYSKCLARKHVPEVADSTQNQAVSMVNIPVPMIEEAKNLIGQEKIQFLYSIPLEYMSQADKALYYILKNILSRGESTPADDVTPEADLSRPTNVEGVSNIRITKRNSTHCEDAIPEDIMDSYTGEDIQNAQSFQADAVAEEVVSDFSMEEMLNREYPVAPEPSLPEIARDALKDITNTKHSSLDLNNLPVFSTLSTPEANSSSQQTEHTEEAPTLCDDAVVAENPAKRRKISISEILTTPPTPKRVSKHRNYKITSYSVLTASERLERLQQLETDKMEAEKLRKEKAATRAKIKQEKEEAKKLKAEERIRRSKIKDSSKKKKEDKENRCCKKKT